MSDAGEGLIDADARIQERMEELERDRMQTKKKDLRDPEKVRAFESLRLARTELERQFESTAHEARRVQLRQALDEIERRMTEMHIVLQAQR